MSKEEYIQEVKDDKIFPEDFKEMLIEDVKNMSDKEFQDYLKGIEDYKKSDEYHTFDDREQWEVVAFA